MTRIDFYQLGRGNAEDFAAKLCAKALRQNLRVYVMAADAAQAERLDTRLWASDPDTFIPHDLAEDADPDTPLVIGTGPTALDFDVLVQLQDTVPLSFSNYDRVAEIVPDDEAARQHCRTRWTFYKERGYALQYHDI